MSSIGFYDALRAHMPDEVARLIADRLPDTDELARLIADRLPNTEALATKADLMEPRADVRGWMLSFFVPLWIGVYGTLAAVVISLIVRG